MKKEDFTTSFPSRLELRIDWSELDLFGHVNNVQFLKYIQAARVNYWEKTILYKRFLEEKIGPMLAAVKCDFRRPLFYPGLVIAESGIAFIGNTSFGLRHKLYNESREIVAEAEDTMVYFNFNTNNKMTIPDDLRQNFIDLEKNHLQQK